MKNSIKEKIKYTFDNIMSKGMGAMLIMLGILFLLALFIVSLFIFIIPYSTNGAPVDNPVDLKKNFLLLMWMSFVRTLDPGTMGGDSNIYGLFSIIATCAGIFILSAFIGILNSGIQDKLENLKKGKSKVIEKDQTIILGWSEQVFTIISELITANLNKNKSCITIMGDKDKVEMEDEIKDKIGKSGKTKIVCRQGSPIDINDLKIVNLNNSKSIILLSPENKDDPDSNVIKTILAITNSPERRKEPFNIVAEIRDPKNIKISKIVGKDELEIVLVGDLISRVIAQTCRQPGLSVVYTELLDFGGAEIYFKEELSLAGIKFKDSLFKYEDSTVIGIFRNNNLSMINPDMNMIINKGDKLIVIAEDDGGIMLSTKQNYEINNNAFSTKQEKSIVTETTLILGWNWRVCTIINELDNYVPKNSIVQIVADFENGQEIINKECENIKNLKIKYLNEDSANRNILDKLLIEDNYDHIIVVCYDFPDVQQSDAKTLITLLHLRDIKEKSGKNYSIVSEMLDIKNKNLAEIAKVNDFVVSDKLISLLLSQISENKYLNSVFKDLFDPDGSEIYLKPASDYVHINTEINFYTVIESASSRGEIPIGYKIDSLSNNSEKAYGVVINPIKSGKIKLLENDKIIVIAED